MPRLHVAIKIVPVILLATAFAGCVEEPTPTDPQDIPDLAPIWALPDALPTIDAKEMLERHAEFVTSFPHRQDNSDGHKGARDALEKEFEEMGLDVWRQTFTNGIHQENICGVQMGAVEPTEWVVVGGHYDTTTWDSGSAPGGAPPGSQVSQGAYDDGSGTRITVELARAFSQIDTYYSVLYCAFDGEERGLQGSKQVYQAMAGEVEGFPYIVTKTRGMLDLDMFGICWPVRAPIFFDQNNKVLHDNVQAIRKEMGIPDDMFKATDLRVLGLVALGTSDYGHWYNEGIPTAFYISDFIELGVPVPVEGVPTPATPAGAYPWWHWQDTVETMTAMAGGPDMLAKGFQTALTLSVETLAIFALHGEIDLPHTEN